jgi:hypothetical protein
MTRALIAFVAAVSAYALLWFCGPIGELIAFILCWPGGVIASCLHLGDMIDVLANITGFIELFLIFWFLITICGRKRNHTAPRPIVIPRAHD